MPTVPPSLDLNVSGDMGNNGWYKSDVSVNMTANDNIGVQDIEYIYDNENTSREYANNVLIIDEGIRNIYAVAKDYNNNYSEVKQKEIKIDKTPPTIAVNIQDRSEYILNQNVTLTYSASDAISGLESVASSVNDNSLIDTKTPGIKTITITAYDKAGNEAKKTITYYVRYIYSGLLDPINTNSEFKLGRTIPVKFQLKDFYGNYVNNAIAKLYLESIVNGVPGPDIPAESTSSAVSDNTFRYDNNENQYIFNLSTKKLIEGTWRLKITLDDNSTKYTIITLISK